jgi:hypothetical protein
MASASSRTLGCIAATFALFGCAVAVENPPAYDAERNLCTAKRSKEWNAMVDSCRERFEDDAGCGGLISFTGQLENEALTVDSELGANEFYDHIGLDGVELRQQLKLYGRSPYFAFAFELRGLGGELSDEGGQARSLSFGSSDGRFEPLDDDMVRGAFRMTVGGETKAFAPRSGKITIESQAHYEQVATFEADFATAGDRVTGCFHAFAVKHILSRDTAQDAGP